MNLKIYKIKYFAVLIIDEIFIKKLLNITERDKQCPICAEYKISLAITFFYRPTHNLKFTDARMSIFCFPFSTIYKKKIC